MTSTTEETPEEEVATGGPLPELVEREAALDALGRRLHDRIGRAGNVVVNHPAELRLLQRLDRDGLDSFARAHGLNVVVHGHSYEFTHRAARH